MGKVAQSWVLAALLALIPARAALADKADSVLAVLNADGARVLEFPLRDGQRWCLLWNHSVAGFTVRDCFVYRSPHMLLERSHQPDFAAGLGHIEGRGWVRPDGRGGYWIEGIDEVLGDGGLRLRVGSPAVDHRIALSNTVTSISRLLAGQRATIAHFSD